MDEFDKFLNELNEEQEKEPEEEKAPAPSIYGVVAGWVPAVMRTVGFCATREKAEELRKRYIEMFEPSERAKEATGEWTCYVFEVGLIDDLDEWEASPAIIQQLVAHKMVEKQIEEAPPMEELFPEWYSDEEEDDEEMGV